MSVVTKNTEVTKAYKAPRLTVYGSVTELTASGSDTKTENGGHPLGFAG